MLCPTMTCPVALAFLPTTKAVQASTVDAAKQLSAAKTKCATFLQNKLVFFMSAIITYLRERCGLRKGAGQRRD